MDGPFKKIYIFQSMTPEVHLSICFHLNQLFTEFGLSGHSKEGSFSDRTSGMTVLNGCLGKLPKKNRFFLGDLSQMWVGGVADSQTRSKPLKTPPNHPENRLFRPEFHLSFSQISQKR